MSKKLILKEDQPNIIDVKIACGIIRFEAGYDTNGKIRITLRIKHNSGGCEANLRAIGSFLTLWYNDRRLSREKVIEELMEIDCLNCHRQKGKLLGEGKNLDGWNRSCPNAIAKTLKEIEWIDSAKK